MEGCEGLLPRSDSAAQTEVTGAAAGSMVNIPEAQTTVEINNTGARDQSPPEGGNKRA